MRTGSATGCPVTPWPIASPLIPFFWSLKVEGNEIGSVEDGIGSGGGVVAPRADKEGDVADTEGCGLVVGPGFAVLPGAKEEEKGKEGEISDVLLDRAALECTFVDVEEQGEGDGPDAGGSWVVLLVFCQLPS